MNKKIIFLCLVFSMSIIQINITSSLNASNNSVQAIILAAGQGSRFKTGITKMIAPICGQPMVLYAVNLMTKLLLPTTVVVGYQKDLVMSTISNSYGQNITFAEQEQQLGTGHALLCSKSTWQADNILVLNGDLPLITADIINTLREEHFKHNAAISIITSYNIDPANAFGRIVQQGNHIKIVEKKHFTYDIKDHPYVNCGVYLINRLFLDSFLDQIKQNNTSKEFYITDLVEIASSNSLPVITVPMPFEPLNGVNTFQELAYAEKIKHDELINYWMTNGVRFIAPDTIHMDYNVKIAKGTVVQAGAQLLNGTTIGEFCTIGAHAVLDNATIQDNATIGANSMLENFVVSKGQHIKACSHYIN